MKSNPVLTKQQTFNSSRIITKTTLIPQGEINACFSMLFLSEDMHIASVKERFVKQRFLHLRSVLRKYDHC